MMQSLYELLKASKGLPVSDSYAALWAKKAESGIKTLTGRLPLTFITSENKLRDWVIHGNNDVGKNLLEITNESQTINGVTFTVDKQAGTVTVTRKSALSSDAIMVIEVPDELKGQNLYFSGCPSEGSADTYNVYALDYDTASRAPQWDGTTPSVTDYGEGNNNEVRFVEGHRSQIRLRIKAGYNAENVVFKPMLRKAGTSEVFEPYQIGVGERTKNLVRAIVGKTTAGITFTVDPAGGTVTANGTATGTVQLRIGINKSDEPNNTTVPPGNYYFSGCPSGGSDSSYNCYSWDYDIVARSKQWDGTTNVETNIGQGNCQVQINGHPQSIVLRIAEGYTANNLVFKPMLRPANTTSDFIPYGYQIPLDVRDGKTGEYNYAFDIYIGESPLTEGQSVSKASTGIDIRTIADRENYPNILTTALTNKPEMMIKYKE